MIVKLGDYGQLGVHAAYIVHGNIFRGFKPDKGVGSLQGQRVRVPDWARQVAERWYRGNTPWLVLYVYDAWGLWVVGLEPVFRPKLVRNRSGRYGYGAGPATKQLASTYLFHVLRCIPPGEALVRGAGPQSAGFAFEKDQDDAAVQALKDALTRGGLIYAKSPDTSVAAANPEPASAEPASAEPASAEPASAEPVP